MRAHQIPLGDPLQSRSPHWCGIGVILWTGVTLSNWAPQPACGQVETPPGATSAGEPAAVESPPRRGARPVTPEGSGNESSGPAVAVDFERDIAPLFTRSCLRCHGGGEGVQDDLLISAERARRGGDSRKNLLALPIEANELIRRVRATEPGDRMPLSGPGLAAGEIELLERWIREGAAWPALDRPRYRALKPGLLESAWWTWISNQYAALDGDRYRESCIVLIAIGLLALLQQRGRAMQRGGGVQPGWRGRVLCFCGGISHAALINLVLLDALWAGWRWVDRLGEQKLELRQRIEKYEAEFKASQAQRNHRPPHPPRMHGEYYRGNDERHAGLFNGGFYRTCTFLVELRDETGRRLDWGAPWPREVSVHLELVAAAFATKALFDPRVIQKGGLSEWDSGGQPAEGDCRAVHFRLRPGRDDAWEADFPLNCDNSPTLQGRLFIYDELPSDAEPTTAEPTSVERPTSGGQVHFLIGYELQQKDGCVGRSSQVWMESVLHPPAVVFLKPGQLHPGEWFSAVPIPEISGGNTSDPKLLGIPAHAERLRQP